VEEKRLIQDNVKPRRAIDGTKPIDARLEEALKSYEVSFTLMPLPSKRATEGRDQADQSCPQN
jgi:hypothetical protein